MQNSKKFFIVTFYKCFSFEKIQLLENLLKRQFKKLKIVGTVILTPEGINSTIASQNLISLKKGIALIEKYCGNLEIKNSISDKQPFKKLKIKSRQEIVPSGINLRIENHQGKYVDPEDWHDFISHNDVQTIDVRNEYEIEVGTFKNSISPNTKNFREFNKYIIDNKKLLKRKKIAIFCTGGVRCEKASAMFSENGLENVFQLKGGILNYFEKSKNTDKWEGECFVFDDRVTVKTNLEPGNFHQCFACRRPLSNKDLLKPEYLKGVSCHKCIDEKTDEDRLRYKERHKQYKNQQL